MSIDRIPPLPALEPDTLDWLLNRMDRLTFEALDAFIDYQEPLPFDIPPGGYRTRFRVSNVLTSPEGGYAPSRQTRYDQRFLTCALADVPDTRLLLRDPPDPYWNRPADPASDPAGEARWQRMLQEHQDHAFNVAQVCYGLGQAWGYALDQYAKAAPYSGPMAAGRPTLYLIPHVSLPDWDLVHDLVRRRDIRHLILLTARQELGHFYRLVVEWRDRAEGRQEIDPRDVCFDSWYRGWIAARRRGYWHSTCTTSGHPLDDLPPLIRHDAPMTVFQPQSDLAWLYRCLEEWYEASYGLLTNPKLCRICRVRVVVGRRVYCSQQCAREGHRGVVRESKRRQRAKATAEAQEMVNQELKQSHERRRMQARQQ